MTDDERADGYRNCERCQVKTWRSAVCADCVAPIVLDKPPPGRLHRVPDARMVRAANRLLQKARDEAATRGDA